VKLTICQWISMCYGVCQRRLSRFCETDKVDGITKKVVKLTICQRHFNGFPGVPAAVEPFLQNRQS
jgi:hypothetical protein